jgi:hypothetical protein
MGAFLGGSLVLLALAGADPLPGVEGIPAPLGRVGDVVEAPAPGGFPAHERVVVATLEGCDRPQAFQLSRFVGAVAGAGEQIQHWLEGKQPGAPLGLERRLFGRKPRLTEAVQKARRSIPVEASASPAAALIDGWKLAVDRAPRKRAPKPASPALGGQFWFVDSKDARTLSALVQLAAAPSTQRDRCRPRLSAVLFDESGKARLRYHADYGGELSVELLGDGCRNIDLLFDPPSQRFRPVPRQGCGDSKR